MHVQNNTGKHLLWVDCHKINGPKEFEQHHHAFLEMSCVLRGTGTYCVNHEEFDMRPGDIFLFSPTDEHRLVLRNEQLEHIVIHIDPFFLWNALGNDMDYKFLMVFFQRNAQFRCRLDRENPAGAQLVQWFREILQESLSRQDCYELMIKIKLQSILAQIIRCYDCIDTGKAALMLRSGDLEKMNQVLAYIEEHLHEKIRLSELAAIAHVSTSYFSTIFKQINGLPPVEYVVGRRIQRAVEYIRTTDMSLADIATACGFNNSTNFYKAFHRVTGRTPASYRKPMAYDAQSQHLQTEPPAIATGTSPKVPIANKNDGEDSSPVLFDLCNACQL